MAKFFNKLVLTMLLFSSKDAVKDILCDSGDGVNDILRVESGDGKLGIIEAFDSRLGSGTRRPPWGT